MSERWCSESILLSWQLGWWSELDSLTDIFGHREQKKSTKSITRTYFNIRIPVELHKKENNFWLYQSIPLAIHTSGSYRMDSPGVTELRGLPQLNRWMRCKTFGRVNCQYLDSKRYSLPSSQVLWYATDTIVINNRSILPLDQKRLLSNIWQQTLFLASSHDTGRTSEYSPRSLVEIRMIFSCKWCM